jgi:hypothetical protein
VSVVSPRAAGCIDRCLATGKQHHGANMLPAAATSEHEPARHH